MIDVTGRYTKDNGYMKIGLLGTLPTMQGTFFKDAILRHGIEVVVPRIDEMQYIGEKSENELEYGIVRDDTCKRLTSIVHRMSKEDGIQAIALSCTELPLFSK